MQNRNAKLNATRCTNFESSPVEHVDLIDIDIELRPAAAELHHALSNPNYEQSAGICSRTPETLPEHLMTRNTRQRTPDNVIPYGFESNVI